MMTLHAVPSFDAVNRLRGSLGKVGSRGTNTCIPRSGGTGRPGRSGDDRTPSCFRHPSYLFIDNITNMPVCVTVLYPGDAKFDLKYYLDHHMPLVGRLFGCVEIRLEHVHQS